MRFVWVSQNFVFWWYYRQKGGREGRKEDEEEDWRRLGILMMGEIFVIFLCCHSMSPHSLGSIIVIILVIFVAFTGSDNHLCFLTFRLSRKNVCRAKHGARANERTSATDERCLLGRTTRMSDPMTRSCVNEKTLTFDTIVNIVKMKEHDCCNVPF